MSNTLKYTYEILIRFKPDGTFKGAHKKSVTIDLEGNFQPVFGVAEPVKREDLVDFFGEKDSQTIHALAVMRGERDTLRADKDRQDEKLRKARERLADKTAECSHLSQQLLHAQLKIESLERAAQAVAVPSQPEVPRQPLAEEV